jgi:hypothetical protein
MKTEPLHQVIKNFTYILIIPTPVAIRLPVVSIVAKPLLAGESEVARTRSPV